MSSSPDPPPVDQSAESDEVRIGGERLTLAATAVAAAAAVVLLAWAGWRWWDEPSRSRSNRDQTRVGVTFAPFPVRPPERSLDLPATEGPATEGPATGAVETDQPGLLVLATLPNSAAARGGVRPGDIWLTAAGLPLCDGLDPGDAASRVRLLRAMVNPDFQFEATLLRDGEPIVLTIRDDAPFRPERSGWTRWAPKLPPERGQMGVEPLATPPTERDGGLGMIISAVRPGGPADEAGLRMGDRIVALRRSAQNVALTRFADELASLITRERPRAPQIPSGAPTNYYVAARGVRPGEVATVDLLRHGRPLSVDVTFVAQNELPRPRSLPSLGF